MYKHVHTYVCASVYACMYAFAYVRADIVCVFACLCAVLCMAAFTDRTMYVRTYVYIPVQLHKHAYTCNYIHLYM